MAAIGSPLSDVTLLTFDELFNRVAGLLKLLESSLPTASA
jgi:hypothetical protein